MAGERRTRLVTAGGLKRCAAIPRLEVRDGPDGRAPPASDRHKRKRGGAVLGQRWKRAGPLWAASACTGKGRRPGSFAG
jgi:hypothetical protein